MSNRYDLMFSNLDAKNQGAFIPFVVVGDPDMETSFEIIRTLVDAGADALELGIPFSDPVADGPVIQASVVRALKNGATPKKCYDIIARVRAQYPDIPIGILTYCNPVISGGLDAYFKMIAATGIDSVLTADMPVNEASAYVEAAKKYEISPVFIAPPNADAATTERIAELTRGYTYVVTRKGVTGTDDEVQTGFKTVIDGLKAVGAPRPVVGFGISKPEQVAASIDAGAAGAISGSAVVKRIEAHLHNLPHMTSVLAAFVSEMKAATNR
ncbi:MAG: tryptophan synthase subunit alpha [Deltaproteobacteria bacterium]|nr:tryptophan synthase subunit alpha [Deltaproteobacteria bacterium]MBN2672556.1 tryptophan synthase subunit alpha [Deltaproteobacteria bacterium]